LVMVIMIFGACEKHNPDTDADDALYSEAKAGGFVYCQSGNILPGVIPSPHGEFRLRFNSVAFAALDSTGELPVGISFPIGSVIVKEILNGGSIGLYAVMEKRSNQWKCR